ncbi:MAG: hypothetical protein AB7H80_09610 [Candidatus Kapaibacterium sp.]
MSLPKKGRRKITVDKSEYGWVASGNDGWIDLCVEAYRNLGRLLQARFDYHHQQLPCDSDSGGIRERQQFAITPVVVRQVIEYGRDAGWVPEEKGLPFYLGYLDSVLDLNIRQ